MGSRNVAVKAITEVWIMAHTDKTYKTLCTKINTEGRYMKTRQKCISYSNYRSHTETQLQWFSRSFISKTTPLQVCKEALSVHEETYQVLVE
jgi:hypothetical protein